MFATLPLQAESLFQEFGPVTSKAQGSNLSVALRLISKEDYCTNVLNLEMAFDVSYGFIPISFYLAKIICKLDNWLSRVKKDSLKIY